LTTTKKKKRRHPRRNLRVYLGEKEKHREIMRLGSTNPQNPKKNQTQASQKLDWKREVQSGHVTNMHKKKADIKKVKKKSKPELQFNFETHETRMKKGDGKNLLT